MEILDWKQIINSLIGSIIAAALFAPITIYSLRRVAGWASHNRVYLGILITIIGASLLLTLVGPSAYSAFKTYSKIHSIMQLARQEGGDEPPPRLSISCVDSCNQSPIRAAEICLDSNVQMPAERIAHYGSRNAAGLRIFISCMSSHGYSVDHCQSTSPLCITIPDTGYRNPGSSIHYKYQCSYKEKDGVACQGA